MNYYNYIHDDNISTYFVLLLENNTTDESDEDIDILLHNQISIFLFKYEQHCIS